MISKLRLGLVSILLITLMGCSGNQWPENKGTLEIREQIEFSLSRTLGTDLGLNKPTSIIKDGNSLYISDTNNDRIVVCDLEGKLIRTIGQTGNGSVEFIKPTGLAIDEEENLYIVDSGNNRVQVLNQQKQLIKQIAVEGFPYMAGSSQLMDIIVEKDTLYLTASTMDRAWAKIIILSKEGEQELVGESLVGQLTKWNEKIQFVSTGQFIKTKQHLSFESGRNYMLHINNKRINQVIELPYKYTAGDIQTLKDEIYMLSKSFGTIDRFDESGNYQATVYQFQGKLDERRGLAAFTFVNKDIYALNSELNVIYHLKFEDK